MEDKEALESITINFERLESIDMKIDDSVLKGISDVIISGEEPHVITRLTGVRWLESVERYPPVQLHKVEFSLLSTWSVAFLVSCAPTCRHLRLAYLPNHHVQHIEQLRNSLPGGSFPLITHLGVTMDSEIPVNSLLTLIPSLEEFDIDVYGTSDTTRDFPLPLSRLKKVTINDCGGQLRPGWIESVRRAAPAGMQVQYKD